MIGHIEAEIRIGTLCQTKEAMPPAIIQTIRQQGGPVDEDQSFEMAFRRCHYFRYMNSPDRIVLDAALDGMLDRVKREYEFWQNYQSRVREGIQTQTPVPVLIRLDPRYVKLILPLVQDYADSLAKKCDRGENLVPPVPRGPVFRMVGDSWNIRYGDRELFAIEDAVGLHYIAHLLERPGQRFPVDELRSIQNARRGEGLGRTKRGAEQAVATGSSDELQIAKDDELASSEAIRKIREKISEIESDLEKARPLDNENEIRRLEGELENHNKWLLSLLRPGGMARTFSGHRRIRNAVRKSILESMFKIGKKDKSLELHLQNSIKLEDLFSYEPDHDVPWNQ